MAPRTAIITGALGQDGSLLAELLLSRGYRVIGLVRSKPAAPPDGALGSVSFAALDLADPTAVQDLLCEQRPDEIYHLAAAHHSSQESELGGKLAIKSAMVQTNFLATKTLAFALLQLRLECHLVFAASSQMFTAVEMCHEVDERSPRQPSSFYGHTKSWSMDLLGLLKKESGLRASTTILFNHESPRRGSQFVSRKITLAAAQASLGLRPSLHLQNIGARVDWSSAHDVVNALSMVGRSEAPSDYVVASGTLHTVRQLLETAFGHLGLDWARHASYTEVRETPALVGRPHQLEAALGWRRAKDFDSMVAEMVDHDLKVLNALKT
jgi:GDPmannose 4,6-dehydratase